MYLYEITVSSPLPYEIPKTFREKAWQEWTAIARAMVKYRKEIREQKGKRKEMNQWSVKAIRLTPTQGL